MIGTIRKHSSWLWWVVAGLTIISFIWWGAAPGTRYGSGKNAGYGVIYGQAVTQKDFDAASREYLIYYWWRHHDFPNPNRDRVEIDRGTYERLILKAKAKELGIHVSDDAAVAEANDFLHSLARNGETVPMSAFVERVLQPAGLDVSDFQRFIADNLAIEQLAKAMGMTGALVVPQEASELFDREYQEVSAQAVFFSGSNYLSQVAVTPAAVRQFYTNNMAVYRQPDRVQINYLEYDLTNFMAAAEQKIGKTNLAAQVDATYAQRGQELVPDAMTPEEAKAKIRVMMLRQAAAVTAGSEAKQFLTTLFAMDPVLPENLVTLAKKNGLTVHTTAPFTEADGPDEFAAPAKLIEDAFKLNPDSPFATVPIPGAEAVYVIGLANRLPSEVPPLDQIQSRVVRDFTDHEAAVKARIAATNFYYSATVQMAAGKTFAQTAIAEGQTPFALRPFSLSSPEVPEAAGHAELNEIKQAAFTTPPGRVSRVEPTAEGAFVMFVQSLLPIDEKLKEAKMPGFLEQVRQQGETEAFNLWLELQENREFRNTKVFDELTGHKSAP